MEGIYILNKTKIMTDPMWIGFTFTFFAIALVAGLAMICNINQSKRIGIFGFILFILSIISFAATVIGSNTEPTGRYRYEVTIDDSVSFLDICEKYENVEQNGRIWTLEDKETE